MRRWSGDTIVYHKDITAHRRGARLGSDCAGDQARRREEPRRPEPRSCRPRERARANSEAGRGGGGTFTITNPGVFGALLGTPIINQPQVAILGVGNIEKRPVVIDDAIAIRPMDT